MGKLTAKQKELFNAIPQELRRETALAYIKAGYENQTKAYLAACKKMKRKPSKNPETSASEMLSYPNVIEFINSVKMAAADETQINAAWVLKAAKQVFDRCMQQEPVISNGEPTGEFKFSDSGANKALEIIGKHIDVQAFLTKQETKHVLSDDFNSLLGDAADDTE